MLGAAQLVEYHLDFFHSFTAAYIIIDTREGRYYSGCNTSRNHYPYSIMGRECSECGEWCSSGDFSRNQWRKGSGNSRCNDCVNGYCSFQCETCYREFNTSNELNMHRQVHRPKNVACPVCGDRRFRSGANAVQHVESGYCTGCRGTDNARDQIYRFANAQSGMRPYLTNTPMLTNGGYQDGSTPDYPYECRPCNKSFRQMSQLLQHNDQKHGQTRMLQY